MNTTTAKCVQTGIPTCKFSKDNYGRYQPLDTQACANSFTLSNVTCVDHNSHDIYQNSHSGDHISHATDHNLQAVNKYLRDADFVSVKRLGLNEVNLSSCAHQISNPRRQYSTVRSQLLHLDEQIFQDRIHPSIQRQTFSTCQSPRRKFEEFRFTC
jgi:hypothetical protein